MTKMIPSTDLRNKYNEVSKYCLETAEPVIVTRNGRNDLVIMSPLAFEHFECRLWQKRNISLIFIISAKLNIFIYYKIERAQNIS